MKNKTKNILMSIAQILVREKNDKFQGKRVLLDVWSQISLITKE